MVVVLSVGACAGTAGNETASSVPDSAQPTSSVATPTEPTSTDTAPQVAGVSLLPSGLGVVSFGEPADMALPLLEQALGQPASDWTETGDLPGGYGGRNATVRFVDFGGLLLVFTD